MKSLCGMLLALSMVFGCFAQAIHGNVTSPDGRPISGVEVYGTKEVCCPVSVKWTITKADGSFAISDAGPILHFRREGLRPISLRVTKISEIHAVMTPDKSMTFIRSATAPVVTGSDGTCASLLRQATLCERGETLTTSGTGSRLQMAARWSLGSAQWQATSMRLKRDLPSRSLFPSIL